MAAMWTVIIKNVSGTSKVVEDLGFTINNGAQITLSDQLTYPEIAGSDDLRDLVALGSSTGLVVNDGTSDLSAANGVKWLTVENIKDLEDLYYNKTELQTSGSSNVHWNNITNTPEFGSPRWRDPVLARVRDIASGSPGSPVSGDFYVDTDDNHLYKYDGSTWNVSVSAAEGNRVINLNDSKEDIWELTSGTWSHTYTPSANDAVLVKDDGDTKQAQYVWQEATQTWQKIADIDWTDHFDGGPSKHDASEIDVEGTYTYLPSAPTDLETAIGDLNTSLSSLYTSAGNSWNPHLNGTANKHDASEIDVEGTYTYLTTGDLETVIGEIDTELGNIETSAGDYESRISSLESSASSSWNPHLDGGANKHDASEIDVEGTYNYISTGDLETAISDIDTELNSIEVSAANFDTRIDSLETSASNYWNPHLDGGANKHDASEIDVEGTYTYVSTGDLETAISDIDTQLGNIETSAGNLDTRIDSLETSASTYWNPHLDGGANKHDASEIDVEGTYNYISTGDLETAISDIDDTLGTLSANVSAYTLDAAYDANGGSGSGRVITVDSGSVKLDSTSGNYAPVELTDRASAPSTGSAAGQLAVINGILYAYDSDRSKWLSVQRMFLMFGKRGNTRDQYLSFYGSDMTSNNSGIRVPRNATIVSMSAELDAAAPAGNATFYVRKNDVATNIESLQVMNGQVGAHDTSSTIDTDISAGDFLQAWLDSDSNVEDPIVMVEIAWRA
jgi:hypothetical protein